MDGEEPEIKVEEGHSVDLDKLVNESIKHLSTATFSSSNRFLMPCRSGLIATLTQVVSSFSSSPEVLTSKQVAQGFSA